MSALPVQWHERYINPDELMLLGEVIVALTEGATSHATVNGGWPANENDGHIGVMQDIVRCAQAAIAFEATDTYKIEAERGLPGVYLYDIIEPMGAWFIDNYVESPDGGRTNEPLTEMFTTEIVERFGKWVAHQQTVLVTAHLVTFIADAPEGKRRYLPTIDTLCDGTVPWEWEGEGDERRPAMHDTEGEAESYIATEMKELREADMDPDDVTLVQVIDAGDVVYDADTKRIYWRKGDGQ